MVVKQAMAPMVHLKAYLMELESFKSLKNPIRIGISGVLLIISVTTWIRTEYSEIDTLPVHKPGDSRTLWICCDSYYYVVYILLIVGTLIVLVAGIMFLVYMRNTAYSSSGYTPVLYKMLTS